MTNIPQNIVEAVNVLRLNDFSNRGILVNINNEYFNFKDQEVNKAFELLQATYITWRDTDFDALVKYLYNIGGKN